MKPTSSARSGRDASSPRQVHFGGRVTDRATQQKPRHIPWLEMGVAAALIGLVAAGTAVSVVAARRSQEARHLDADNLASLNKMADAYYMATGEWPDKWLAQLNAKGYTDQQYHPTPYGGYYTFDFESKRVVNSFVHR